MKSHHCYLIVWAVLCVALGGCYDKKDARNPDLFLNAPAAAIETKYVEIDGRTYLAQKLPITIRDGNSVHFYRNRWVIVAGPIPKAKGD